MTQDPVFRHFFLYLCAWECQPDSLLQTTSTHRQLSPGYLRPRPPSWTLRLDSPQTGHLVFLPASTPSTATALHQGLRLNTGWVYRLSSHSPHSICLQNLLPLLGNKPRVQSLLTASTRTLRYQASVVSTLAYCSGSRRRPFVSCLFQCSSSQLGVILASGQGHVFGFHNWGKGCYRHLVSGGQKCCWRSSNGQDRPLQQRTVWIKRSVALRLKIFALPVLNTIAQGDPTKTDIKSCHVPAQ